MAKLISKKCRLCRSCEMKLFLKGSRCNSPKCPITKKGAVLPGQRKQRRMKRKSDYGIRLNETQKLKRTYGLSEKRLKNYFVDAKKSKEATGERLLQILESRLDNIIYRLGFAPSRRLAHQLVNHRHVLVNGKIVNIPSYLVKTGEVISLDTKALQVELVMKTVEDKSYVLPGWLEKKGAAGKVLRLPKREEAGMGINEQLIIEYYSRK